ncbi:hypothetical protein ACVW00_003804 [Marmoricola sp. URHA0025 HA25]
MSSQTPRRDAETRPELGVAMPPTNMGLLAAAGVCLVVPVIALLWVTSYAKETPRLGGIPFFFWYQFAWVFLTSAFTYAAHRLVLAARGRTGDDDAEPEAPPNQPVGDGDTLSPTPGFRS